MHANQSVDYKAKNINVIKNCAERGECCSCLPQGRRPRWITEEYLPVELTQFRII